MHHITYVRVLGPRCARACIGLGIALLASCTEPTAPTVAPVVRVDPQWVTGAAAAAVDPVTRLFVLQPGVSARLTPLAAESAAVAYIRFSLNPGTLGNARSTLESDRGAPIAQWNRLFPCGRTMYVESPVGAAPDSSQRNLIQYMRSAWSVTLCGPNGEPQVGVGVSDTRSGARFVGPDYLLADIDSIGQMHASMGLRRSLGGAPHPSPEAAVRALFIATGVPVAAVPRPRIHWAPLMTIATIPIWELQLASAVTATFDNGESTPSFTRVFVRLITEDSLEFSVPSEEQPDVLWMPYPISFDPFVNDSLAFPVIHPVALRRVRFQ